MYKLLLALFSLTFFVLVSCSDDEEPTSPTPSTDACDNISVTYTSDVKSILDGSCATAGCHSANTQSAGLDYSSYTAAAQSAGGSKFLGSVRHTSGFSPMPKGGNKLADDQITILECWIEQGLPE